MSQVVPERPKKTFLSYSRRQLYFAESLALHLQNAGIEIWFDLQRLTPGTVWSKGLTDGVGAADRLILIASKAALESPYTREEWEAVVDRGRELVLVLYEPVELPERLASFPVYDFRGDFRAKLSQLLAFLRGEEEPRHDPVPAPGRLGFSMAAPTVVRLTVLALFLPVIASLLGLLGSFRPMNDGGGFWATLFWGSCALGLGLGARDAFRFWRHTIGYGTLKRGTQVALVLWFVTFAVVALTSGRILPSALAGVVGLLGLYVRFFALPRSIDVLRWLQPQDALQTLRRRVHQPLFAETGLELDVGVEPDARAVTYAVHADAADLPLARKLEGVFAGAGLARVDADQEPRYHVAILSNRTSEAEAQRIAAAHGGNVVFVVASTIEFRGSLKEVGSYQWVDFREGDPLDLEGLARNLVDPEGQSRESALEVTPDKIDRWKVPGGINLLKRFMQIYGGWLLFNGLIGLVGVPVQLLLGQDPVGTGDAIGILSSLTVSLAGGVVIWLTTGGLVYRKVPAVTLYGLLLGAVVVATVVSRVHEWRAQEGWGSIWLMNPQVGGGWGLAEIIPWLLVLSILAIARRAGRFWLPAAARVNADEVGIKESIRKSIVRRQILLVGGGVLLIIGGVVAFALIN